ncbi:MAG TPA: hypothetical protein VKB96_02605 [Gammaproteobacteria bacterium]|nr:hypothetical protein [Gammaproteobacteria bacterium]
MQYVEEAVTIQKTEADKWDVSIFWGCPTRNLGADTIVSSAWSVAGPDETLLLSQDSISADGKETTIWIEGGTVGKFYTITNQITTNNGRIITGSFLVQVVERIFLTQNRCV